ncbi:MAG TPA: hypothetical protein VFI33_17165 [Puia sp.]|nr:hypothetical protein [Puia sp.]
MKKYFTYFLIIITTAFSGCETKHSISQLWFYTYSSDPDPDKSTLTPANFLELRSDKSFNADLGKFQTGHWDFKDQQLFLHADNGEINILLVKSLKSKEMLVQTARSDDANFDGQPIPEIAKDPFSGSKNLWRKTAAAKETDEQLKSRLRNHCQFWVSYFNWALDNELTTVDVRSTPSPIKIFGNGFTIKAYADLPETWKGYFYDSTDCARATTILEDVVRTHTIAWPHSDNKYKMFISAFQQMQHLLR